MKLINKLTKGSLAMVMLSLTALAQAEPYLEEGKLNRVSSRLDAIQLRLAVEDDVNKIGLYQWGNNPAGLVLDEEASRVAVMGKQSSDKVEDSDFKIKSTDIGLLGIFRNDQIGIEFQGVDNSEKFDLMEEQKYDFQQSQLVINPEFGNFLLGVKAGVSREDTNETDIGNLPQNYAAGLAWNQSLTNGSFTFGVSHDLERQNLDVAEFDVSHDLNTTGLQAILQIKDWTTGIAYEHAVQKDDVVPIMTMDILNVSHEKISGDAVYFQSRVKIPNSPVLLGVKADMAKAKLTSQYAEGFVSTRSEGKSKASDLGIGASLVSNRIGLIGVEVGQRALKTNTETDVYVLIPPYNFLNPFSNVSTKEKTNYAAIGCEVNFTSFLSGRASYKHNKTILDDNYRVAFLSGNDSYEYTHPAIAVGLGLKLGESANIDANYERKRYDFGGTSTDEIETTAQLVGSIRF